MSSRPREARPGAWALWARRRFPPSPRAALVHGTRPSGCSDPGAPFRRNRPRREGRGSQRPALPSPGKPSGAPRGARALGLSRKAEIEPPADLVDRREPDAQAVSETVGLSAGPPAQSMLLLLVHEDVLAERGDGDESLDEEILQHDEEAE